MDKVSSQHLSFFLSPWSSGSGTFSDSSLYVVMYSILGISCSEAAMTGEPEPVHKSVENPWFLSGCMVQEGVAQGLVIATGMPTNLSVYLSIYPSIYLSIYRIRRQSLMY